MLSKFSSFTIFATLTLVLKVSSIAVPASPVFDAVVAATTSALMSGDGTWYGDDCGEEACWQGGACAFVDYTLPTTIAGSTCVSELIWDDSSPCGGCVSITYDNTTKIAMITNKTGGDAVHLDMTPDMFSQLADKSLGEIDIEWEYVACPITDPLEIRMHTGASQYWFAATVLNAIYRTSKLEVSSDGGSTYTAATRNTNGYYEVSGGTGTTTAWVRVTSETGTQVVVENVSITASTVTTATANYA